MKAILLVLLVPALATLAENSPRAVIVSSPHKNIAGCYTPESLKLITEDGSSNLAQLHDRIYFGTDESILAVFQLNKSAPNGRLIIFDRNAFTIKKDRNLENAKIEQRITKFGVEASLVVSATNQMVYLPLIGDTLDKARFLKFCWRTESMTKLPYPYSGLRVPEQFVPLPSGFAAIFSDSTNLIGAYTAGLVNTADMDIRLVRLLPQYQDDQVLFVPGIGLLQHHDAALFRLTDETLSTNVMQHREPISGNAGHILVRQFHNKVCLVWGEIRPGSSDYPLLSAIVMYDPETHREILRKDLHAPVRSFLPNDDCTRIYVVDLKDGKLKYFSGDSESTRSLSGESFPNPVGVTIIDAY